MDERIAYKAGLRAGLRATRWDDQEEVPPDDYDAAQIHEWDKGWYAGFRVANG